MVLYSPIDHGYAWIVLAGAIMDNVLLGLFAGSMGIMMLEYTHFFNISKTQTSWVGACAMVNGPIMAFFLSGLVKKIGVRLTCFLAVSLVVFGHVLIFAYTSFWMVFTAYGLIVATGMFLLYQTTLTINQLYFQTKRSIASGVSTFGISFGVLISPLITQMLLDIYDLRGCILIIGGIQMHGLVFSSFFRPPQVYQKKKTPIYKKNVALDDANECKEMMIMNGVAEEPADYQEEVTVTPNKNETDVEAKGRTTIKSKCKVWREHFTMYTIFLMAFTLGNISDTFVLMFTPMVAETMGMGAHHRAMLVTVLGMTGAIAKPTAGLLGNSPCMGPNSRPAMYGLSNIINGGLILLSTVLTTFPLMAAHVGIYGFIGGGYAGIMSAVIGDVLISKYAEIGSGLLMLCHSLSFLIVYPLSGWLMDISGHARYNCYVFGSLQLIGGILCLSIPIIRIINK